MSVFETCNHQRLELSVIEKRWTLNSFIEQLISKSNTTKSLFRRLTNNFQSHSSENHGTLSNKTIKYILIALPPNIVINIFISLSYNRLISLTQASNLDIKFAAEQGLIKKLKTNLNIQGINQENYLNTVKLLLKAFGLFSNISRPPISIQTLSNCKSFDEFITRIESLALDEAFEVNTFIFKNYRVFGSECIEIFLKMFLTKTKNNEQILSSLNQNILRYQIDLLLTISVHTNNINIIKYGLQLFGNITNLSQTMLNTNINIALHNKNYECIILIIKQLFSVELSNESTNTAVLICYNLIENTISSNSIHQLPEFLKIIPFNNIQAIQCVQNLHNTLIQRRRELSDEMIAKTKEVITIIQKTYNLI